MTPTSFPIKKVKTAAEKVAEFESKLKDSVAWSFESVSWWQNLFRQQSSFCPSNAITFMGSDAIRGAKEIIITGGAPDWVSVVDHGFAALSPVTTNFRDEDLEKLAQSVASAEAVYIINDKEENQAGLVGAMKTAKHLALCGHNVYQKLSALNQQGIRLITLRRRGKNMTDKTETLEPWQNRLRDLWML